MKLILRISSHHRLPRSTEKPLTTITHASNCPDGTLDPLQTCEYVAKSTISCQAFANEQNTMNNGNGDNYL